MLIRPGAIPKGIIAQDRKTKASIGQDHRPEGQGPRAILSGELCKVSCPLVYLTRPTLQLLKLYKEFFCGINLLN